MSSIDLLSTKGMHMKQTNLRKIILLYWLKLWLKMPFFQIDIKNDLASDSSETNA
jgi:hypothetical protein